MYQMIFKLGLLFAIVFNIMVVQVEVRDNLVKKTLRKVQRRVARSTESKKSPRCEIRRYKLGAILINLH